MAAATSKSKSGPLVYEALRKYECALTESLASVDLVSFAVCAVRNRLLTEGVKDVFKSIHPEVPHPVKCRYLLYSIYDHIFLVSKDDEKAECLLKVLSQYRPVASVVSLVRQSLTGECSAIKLTENDVPALTESLSSHSSKWKEIATSLRLPDNEIKNIMSMMHMYTPVMCLKEVLTVWASCKHPQAKPPTLETLKKALSSRLVGLGKLSKKLTLKAVVEARKCLNPSVAECAEGRVYPSVAECGEGRVYALLEVLLSWSSPHQVEVEWLKDGVKLELDDIVNNYCGCIIAIGCIPINDITAEGAYSCKMKSLSSDPIKLRKNTFGSLCKKTC